MKTYDLAVIGAGSGGLVAALTANRSGLKTAMIEKNKIGGECTHYGCVPSKALINSAKWFHSLKGHPRFGLPKAQYSTPFDFRNVMEHVDDIVQGIYEHEKPEVFEKLGIDTYVHPSGARFLDTNRVQIGEEIISAEATIICTGSSPGKISLPGSDQVHFLHNENFWEIRDQPRSITFIGGGVISAELGQALSRLGTEVTIMERNPRILKAVDEEVALEMIRKFEAEGIRMISNAQLAAFQQSETGIKVSYKQAGEQKTLETECVFLATGRVPNINGLDLENAGIDHSPRGIITNEFLQTSAPNIYACGDVTTPAKFTHTASYQANICLANIMKGNHRVNDLTVLPWAIFTGPEIAHVGLSEKQAREKEPDVQVFKVNANIDRFITDGNIGGFLKVYFGKNDKVLGADAIGAHAGEWIQLITFIMQYNIPIDDIDFTIFIYPTYSEIVKKVFSRYMRTKM